MGIDTESARFLLQSRKAGVSFERCATLGRQHYFPGVQETKSLLKECGFEDSVSTDWMGAQHPRFSDEFWHSLGAKELSTIDASEFEGATHVHDMNIPLPEDWKCYFDAVCDVGTLEHVFNFPQAIQNAMEMVREGGHLMTFTTANNYFGHGFYQFSPELFYRVLSPENGFEMVRMVAVEYGPRRRWYEVADPARIGHRATLVNSFPVLLFVLAQRKRVKAVFEHFPQQSDYTSIWSASTVGSDPSSQSKDRLEAAALKSPGWKQLLIERTPGVARFLEAFLFSGLNRSFSFKNATTFRPVKKKNKLL